MACNVSVHSMLYICSEDKISEKYKGMPLFRFLGSIIICQNVSQVLMILKDILHRTTFVFATRDSF
jgi:hypothetical protein